MNSPFVILNVYKIKRVKRLSEQSPAVRLEMCSVAGCTSLAQRFRLPRDPERRLEWVQFLATANEQQFKESSWRDFRVCCKHFTEDCFDNLMPTRLESTGKVRLTLKPAAVPSLCVQPDGGQSEEQVSLLLDHQFSS